MLENVSENKPELSWMLLCDDYKEQEETAAAADDEYEPLQHRTIKL